MSKSKSTTLHAVSSTEPPRWLWNHFHALNHLDTYILSHLAHRVAVTLLAYANNAGECYPGYVLLQRRCQCSKYGLAAAIHELEDRHVIAINHGKKRRKSNRYVLTFALHAPSS